MATIDIDLHILLEIVNNTKRQSVLMAEIDTKYNEYKKLQSQNEALYLHLVCVVKGEKKGGD